MRNLTFLSSWQDSPSPASITFFPGSCSSIGNTRAALAFLAAAITANIALDFLFIGVLGFGTGGAAAATILSQLFSAVCCFLYLRDTYPGLLCRRDDIGAHRDLMARTLRFGLISALQASSLYIGKILVQGSVNTLGTLGSPPTRPRPELKASQTPSATAAGTPSPSWSPRTLEPETMTG